uniref:hypothetical protein n=1 Tax=Microcoleus sp. CAWBG27 TaxID=2841645 RepID=UPI0025F3B783
LRPTKKAKRLVRPTATPSPRSPGSGLCPGPAPFFANSPKTLDKRKPLIANISHMSFRSVLVLVVTVLIQSAFGGRLQPGHFTETATGNIGHNTYTVSITLSGGCYPRTDTASPNDFYISGTNVYADALCGIAPEVDAPAGTETFFVKSLVLNVESAQSIAPYRPMFSSGYTWIKFTSTYFPSGTDVYISAHATFKSNLDGHEENRVLPLFAPVYNVVTPWRMDHRLTVHRAENSGWSPAKQAEYIQKFEQASSQVIQALVAAYAGANFEFARSANDVTTVGAFNPNVSLEVSKGNVYDSLRHSTAFTTITHGLNSQGLPDNLGLVHDALGAGFNANSQEQRMLPATGNKSLKHALTMLNMGFPLTSVSFVVACRTAMGPDGESNSSDNSPLGANSSLAPLAGAYVGFARDIGTYAIRIDDGSYDIIPLQDYILEYCELLHLGFTVSEACVEMNNKYTLPFECFQLTEVEIDSLPTKPLRYYGFSGATFNTVSKSPYERDILDSQNKLIPLRARWYLLREDF